MKIIIDIIGVIGILYWLLTLFVLIRRPILRDRCIINGFTKYVLLLVVLTPFAMEFIVSNCCGMVSPRELVYTPDLYKAPDNQLSDTIRARQEDPSWLWGIYYLMIDPGNQHMTTSQPGRAVGVIMAILGVFLLNGLLVSTLMSWFDRRKERWLKGEIRYRNLKGHTVIIGSGPTVSGIVRQITDRKGYILIMTSCDVETFRRELFSVLPESEHKKIILYYGDSSSEKDIRSLRIDASVEVYVIGEISDQDDTGACADISNMRCLQLIASCCSGMEGRITCRAMFESQTTHSVFQFSDISDTLKAHIDFKPFNFYEQWARNVLVNWPGKLSSRRYLPLEGENGISADSRDQVILFIAGMTRMGLAMAVEAAHLAHYPNFATKGIKTRISFIDINAEQEARSFISRFNGLFRNSSWRITDAGSYDSGQWHIPEGAGWLGDDVTDVEWEFIKGDIDDPAIRNLLSASAGRTETRMTVAVCSDNPDKAAASTLYLPDEVLHKAVQILVYQRKGASVIDSISKDCAGNTVYRSVHPFGMAAECYDKAVIQASEDIALRLSQAYAETCTALGHNRSSTGHDNTSGKQYKGKSAAAKWWSNIYNADTVWSKLRSINYKGGKISDNDDILARTEHSRWNMEQLLMRFRPLTLEEQKELLNGNLDKEDLKGERMAHSNICSWERLKEIDPDAILYDKAMINALPEVYEYTLTAHGKDSK